MLALSDGSSVARHTGLAPSERCVSAPVLRARTRRRVCRRVPISAPLSDFRATAEASNLPYYLDYNDVGTTRMFRIFQNTGTRIELLERADWELQAPFNQEEGVRAWFPDPELYRDVDAASRLKRDAAVYLWDQLPDIAVQDIAAVVIKDLGKGCVSSATVQWIKTQVPADIPWYVSSKSWQPLWFKDIPKNSLKLLMIPQVAARIASKKGAVRSWLTDSGLPTRDAIECIDKLYEKYDRDQTYVVVLPNKQQVLFRGPFDDFDCHVQKLIEPVDLDFEVAMASVFLPALVPYLLRSDDKKKFMSEEVRAAASFADEWMKREVERIRATEDLNPPKRLTLDIGEQYAQSGEWRSLRWETERLGWRKALSDMGIIDDSGVSSIELARAMTVLDGYICLAGHKQELVQRLIREVRRFIGARSRKHVSFLMTALPGSGKSALIDALVKAEALTSYTINVAQLVGRLGVIDEFDTVATLQSQNPGEPLLVFVDEINSMLESQHVYDLFLSAMQNGEYVRGGNRFRLTPCMWIFAGTAKPSEHGCDPATKAKDFESRLTIAPLSFDRPDLSITERPGTDDEIRLERVYLGAAILTAQFPDVLRVTRKVLQLFHLLPDSCTLRDLVKLISGFEDVQLGRVHSGNVPKAIFSQIESLTSFDYSNWNRHDEGGFVKIVAR